MRKQFQRTKTWLLTLAMLCLSSPATADRTLTFEAVPDQPIISFTQIHGRVRGSSEHAMLRIYASGTVRVNLPFYMKGAGNYEYQLSPSALQGLLHKLMVYGVLDFDASSVKTQLSAAKAARRASSGERYFISDPTLTRIELNFEQFGNRDEKGRAIKQIIEWTDVAMEAKRHPQLSALKGLADAEQMLKSMQKHQKFNAVKITGAQ